MKSQAREASPSIAVNVSSGQASASASGVTVGVIREGVTLWSSTSTVADPPMTLHRDQVSVQAAEAEVSFTEFGGCSEIGQEIEIDGVASKKPEQVA